jgi:hypothetical protein
MEKWVHVKTKRHQVPLQLANYWSTGKNLHLELFEEGKRELRTRRFQPDAP